MRARWSPSAHPDRRCLALACIAALAAGCTAVGPLLRPAAESAAPASPSEAPALRTERLSSLEGITEYRLANGLRVLLFPDATKSTVTVNMTYFVGSRNEGYGESGMAHLLEHMTFKGTEKYEKLLSALETRGAFSNGTTSFDRTNYFETLPASPENLDFALDVEAERMRKSKLLGEDLASEFSVVRSEFEIGENSPERVLLQRVLSTAYLWHNYGKSTIGSRSDIERVPIEALREFYDHYYQPDNAMLVVAGQFDESATLARIEAIYGAIPRPERTLRDSYTVEPVQDGERTTTLRRNGDVPVLIAAYHGVAGSDPDFPALEAALDVLTRSPTGRLYGPLVRSRLATGVSGFSWGTREPGVVLFRAQVRDAKNVGKVRKQLLQAVEALGDRAVSEQEVERWRAATLKEIELAQADSQRMALQLSEWAALGDWRLFQAYRQRVQEITVADVQRVAKTWFRASNRTLGEFVPTANAERAPLPEQPDVARIVASLQDTKVESGEAFVASLDNLQARTSIRKLAGGIDAALLPKKTRGGTVQLDLRLRHGSLATLAGLDTARAATAALVQRGTTRRSFQQIEDEKSKLKAQITIRSGEGFTASSSADGQIALSIDTVRESLPAALSLAVEMLKSPSFPADELEVIRQQALAGLEPQLKDPLMRGFSELQRTIAPYPDGDPRQARSAEDQIASWKKLKLADVKAYHRDFFGAGAGQLVVIGDFDADALAAQLERELGDWTARKPFERVPRQVFGVAAIEKKLDIKDKEMATIAIGHDLELRDDAPDYPAAVIAAYVAGGARGSRLWTRLREKEGWSYGTATWVYASPFEAAGGFGGYAMLAPQNLEKARAAIVEELQRLTSDGVDEAELARLKAAWLEQSRNSLADDGRLGPLLTSLLYTRRDFDWIRKQEAAIEALTVEQVNAAARRYIVPSRLIVIEAADYAKVKQGS